MFKVFFSNLSKRYYRISQNNAEIVGYEFNRDYTLLFEGTRKECDNYIAELCEEVEFV